ncbi:MAG: Bax inhibitor-1/YccA family protein [Alphaproteobacteria bacterium]|nr:Bax inhibitor-1/YccA family protein [Alphaproteobacteria bacterium]
MDINEYQHKPAVEVLSGSSSEVDQGLRQYMISVFNYMGAGLLVTALVAYLFATSPALLSLLYNPTTQGMTGLGWLVTFSPLILIFAFNYVAANKSLGTTQFIFWLFSALMGASLSWVCIAYTGHSITRVFLITAGTFGALSLYGYTTNRDLTKLGSFLFMGLIGLIIASIVNIFMQSTALYWALSYIGVAIFVGLTAFDVQRIKQMYYYGSGSGDMTARYAISGALSLYLDFINLFLYLLRIFGDRR